MERTFKPRRMNYDSIWVLNNTINKELVSRSRKQYDSYVHSPIMFVRFWKFKNEKGRNMLQNILDIKLHVRTNRRDLK
jgi:hypothetical protein